MLVTGQLHWIKIFTFERDRKWCIYFYFYFFAKDNILRSVWFPLVPVSVQKVAIFPVFPQNALDESCFLRNTPSRTHHTLQVSLTLRSTGSRSVMNMTLLTQLCHHGNSSLKVSLTEGGVELRFFYQFHIFSNMLLINTLYVGNQTKLQTAVFCLFFFSFFHLLSRLCVTFVLQGCLFSMYPKITKGVLLLHVVD